MTAETLHADGQALRRAGDLDRALETIGRAIDLSPETALFRTSFGVVLAELGEAEAACSAWRSALALDPAEPLAAVNLANAAEARGETETALGLYRRALGIEPANAAALGNLGAFEQRHGEKEAALRRYAKALALDPAEPRLWSNLGSARHWAARLAAAGAAFDRALALDPGLAGARFDRAVNRLLRGDWHRGLVDYEARWLKPGARRLPIAVPAWTGEDPKGKRLLVWAEQGHGDTFQFARFVPLLGRRGARVVLAVPPRLISLLRSLAGAGEVVSLAEPLPAADLQAPLMSLPLLLGLGDRTPAPVAPYLVPPSPATLPSSLARDGRPLVGLNWAGNPVNESDARRSLALDRLRPLLALDGLRFVSLQFGPNAADVAASGLAHRIETPELGDFAATAGIVASLDLVITVDTAMAHLAGAIGTEAWVMLAHVPDWRWGLSGETTSWYPSLRLFRQASPGDWDGVVRRIAAALARRFPGTASG